MPVSELDKSLGLELYATNTIGIRGTIRGSVDDFTVEEVLVDGSVARIEKDSGAQALRASAARQRYLLCVLIKRNWDTFVALKRIAAQLCIDQTRINIAGIKDAKAVTAQHITIENVSVEDVEKIRVKDVKVLPVGYFRDKLSTFYLLGNKFNIVIDKTDGSERSIRNTLTETMRQLELNGGIPNFFGHQRFGTIRPITHLVGKAIVNDDYEQAGMLFLAKPSQYEHPESREAREELLSTRNFSKALESFPIQLRFERLMLRHLVKKPSDFVGAFKQLPFKLQMLFVQAYQSYLFNRFLSQRVSQGMPLNAAEVGDFVVNVERSGLPMVKMSKVVDVDSLAETNRMVNEGKLRVALPLVGFRQKLSQGKMGRIEEEILDLEDANTASFKVVGIPRIGGQGELRSIVSPVKEFNVPSIRNNQVHLSFMLFRGSYATMMLREIIKPDDPLSAGF